MRPTSSLRYKHFILACAKTAAKVDEGLSDAQPMSIRALGRGSSGRTTSTR